jgi:glycosyltransferase involved in cell wall biosynthesis
VVRVLLDATAIPPNRAGVGRELDSLVPALVDAGADVRVLAKPADADHFASLSGQDAVVAWSGTASRAARLGWEQVGLPAAIRRVAPDVVHCPHYTHPLLTRVPLVVTIHDTTFFTEPDVHTTVKGPFFRTATRLALARATYCMVPSHATANDLVRVLGADPARLVVAHHGVDRTVFSPPDAAAVAALRERLGIPAGRGYVAFLGTLEPRKNVPALIAGWSAACADRTNPPALVLAGGSGWDDRLPAAVADVPAMLQLIRPGYLPLADLPALLGGAEIVAYPSLGEGFGLPVLEAMACAAPVLTTRRLALPEVGGDAVAYTEPDPGSIANALRELLDAPERRASLAAAALSRSAQFSWRASAHTHLATYERAASAGLRRWRSVP